MLGKLFARHQETKHGTTYDPFDYKPRAAEESRKAPLPRGSARSDELLSSISRSPTRPGTRTQQERTHSLSDSGNLYETRPYNSKIHRPRAPSICSRNSSRNSSLRGSRVFDRDYQNPIFSRSRAGSGSSYEIAKTKHGLPPPPTQWKPRSMRFSHMLGKVSSNSKADIFDAKIAAALDDADSSTTGSMIEDDESLCGLSERFNQRWNRSESLRRYLSHQRKPSFQTVEAHQQEKIKEGLREFIDEDEAIASSDEEDDDDAIDSDSEDEHEDDWEDSNSDHGKPPVADKSLFQRVDSRINLVSRRSMLITVLHEPERAAALANIASRSSPAIRRTGRQSPVEDESLAQPPVTCYVCGAGITINRRRDWQIHLIHDLKPYTCFVKDCPSAYESYASCNDLMHHVRAIHPNADILDTQSNTVVCIFCNEPLLGSVKKRFNHLSRHMEEISFAIVPKNHEDWEFYNDSDTANEADGKSRTAPPKASADVTESKLALSEGFAKPQKTNTYTIFKPRALPPQVTTTIDPLKPVPGPESLEQASPSFVSSSQKPKSGEKLGGLAHSRMKPTDDVPHVFYWQNQSSGIDRRLPSPSPATPALTASGNQPAEPKYRQDLSYRDWYKLFQGCGLPERSSQLYADSIIAFLDNRRMAANFNLNSVTASDLRTWGGLTDTDAQKVVNIMQSRPYFKVSDAAVSLSTQLDRKEAGKKGGVVDQWMSMMRPTARAEPQRGSLVDSDKSARKKSRKTFDASVKTAKNDSKLTST